MDLDGLSATRQVSRLSERLVLDALGSIAVCGEARAGSALAPPHRQCSETERTGPGIVRILATL
jgi:hypothetical protein